MPDNHPLRPSATGPTVGTWVARIGAIPLIALTAIGFAMLAYGVLVGSIHEIHKYGQGMVNRTTNPVAFWFATAYHSFVLLGLAYITYVCLHSAKWVRKRQGIEDIANRVGTALDPQRPLPMVVPIAILGAFFVTLYYIAQK